MSKPTDPPSASGRAGTGRRDVRGADAAGILEGPGARSDCPLFIFSCKVKWVGLSSFRLPSWPRWCPVRAAPQVARVPVRARGLSGPAGKPPSQSHISSTWSSPGGGCPGGAGASVVLLPTFTQRKRPNGEGWGEPEISSGGDPLGVRLAERREVFDAHKGLIF